MLTFAFLHAGPKSDKKTAAIMVRSLLKTHSGSEIIQMSDLLRPSIEGVSTRVVSMSDAPLMLSRLEQLRHIKSDRLVSLDTDIVVQRNLEHVFDLDFDVAVTARYKQIVFKSGAHAGEPLNETMPYNAGIVFCRTPQFWDDCYQRCRGMSFKDQRWFGDQVAIADAARSGNYKVIELPGDIYNYTPDTEDEDVSVPAVVHYKGKRKIWMIRNSILT